MMDGIKEIADGFGAELRRRLPKQRKTQRTKLALLVATMLDVRSVVWCTDAGVARVDDIG
jgi:hypothetical protein